MKSNLLAIPRIAALLLLAPLSASHAEKLADAPQPPHTTTRAALPSSPPEAPSANQSGFGPLDPTPPKGITPEAIIAKFGERETAFARARNEYTYRQTTKIDTISDDTNKPDGEYLQVNDIVFSEDNSRTEHVVFAPANTISRLIMNQNDFDDIAHRLPFVLTSAELPQYDLTYLGRQRVDDIDTFVFDCKPKTLEKGKRYFQGKVWVDQQQYEIVLINGKSVPDNLRRGHEDLSPPYTTYYQEVDGGNWFPVYTKADATLHFPGGTGYMAQDVHIRYVVKYEDYKRFHAKSRIIYNGEDLPPGDPSKSTPAASPAENPNALPPADPDAPPLTRPAKPQ